MHPSLHHSECKLQSSTFYKSFQEFIVTAVTIEKDLAETNRLLSVAEAKATEVFKEVQEQEITKEEETEDYLCKM